MILCKNDICCESVEMANMFADDEYIHDVNF